MHLHFTMWECCKMVQCLITHYKWGVMPALRCLVSEKNVIKLPCSPLWSQYEWDSHQHKARGYTTLLQSHFMVVWTKDSCTSTSHYCMTFLKSIVWGKTPTQIGNRWPQLQRYKVSASSLHTRSRGYTTLPFKWLFLVVTWNKRTTAHLHHMLACHF